jgi:hypothetical protein
VPRRYECLNLNGIAPPNEKWFLIITKHKIAGSKRCAGSAEEFKKANVIGARNGKLPVVHFLLPVSAKWDPQTLCAKAASLAWITSDLITISILQVAKAFGV